MEAVEPAVAAVALIQAARRQDAQRAVGVGVILGDGVVLVAVEDEIDAVGQASAGVGGVGQEGEGVVGQGQAEAGQGRAVAARREGVELVLGQQQLLGVVVVAAQPG